MQNFFNVVFFFYFTFVFVRISQTKTTTIWRESFCKKNSKLEQFFFLYNCCEIPVFASLCFVVFLQIKIDIKIERKRENFCWKGILHHFRHFHFHELFLILTHQMNLFLWICCEWMTTKIRRKKLKADDLWLIDFSCVSDLCEVCNDTTKTTTYILVSCTLWSFFLHSIIRNMWVRELYWGQKWSREETRSVSTTLDCNFFFTLSFSSNNVTRKIIIVWM